MGEESKKYPEHLEYIDCEYSHHGSKTSVFNIGFTVYCKST